MEGEMADEGGEEAVILFEEQPMAREENQRAFPWYAETTRKLSDPILRMHNEAIQFYLFISPHTEIEKHTSKLNLYQKIRKIIDGLIETGTVLSPFLHNKLYLRDTEVELYVLLPELTKQKADLLGLGLSQHLGNLSVPPESQQRYQIYQWQLQVQGEKVVIRVLDRQDWLDFFGLIDQNVQGIIELKYVYMIFSCMIRQRWMHLGIRPYLLFALLSVFYHQRRKQKHRTLSENIIKFVEYYGVGPFQERRVNYLGKGRYELMQEGQGPTPFSFWINQRCNIACPLLKDFFGILKNRYRLISNYNFDEQQSVIGSLVNPCQKQFSYI